MEKIVKKIKFNPDTNINIVINLKNKFYDIGFYTDSEYDTNSPLLNNKNIIINGTGISRLNELKKYTESNLISNKYILSNGISNGVVLSETNQDKITYIIDKIKYIDSLTDGSTEFTYKIPNKYQDLDSRFLVKEDRFLNYIDYKEKKDLDIVRQSLNIFESHIRLTDIRNVEELTLYGGGYYKIFKNS
jgi:hypothetical protein